MNVCILYTVCEQTKLRCEKGQLKIKLNVSTNKIRDLRVIFSEYRESEETHEKSIFRLFHQNIPLGELIQGKIV